MIGCPSAAKDALPCRMNRTHSRRHSVHAGEPRGGTNRLARIGFEWAAGGQQELDWWRRTSFRVALALRIEALFEITGLRTTRLGRGLFYAFQPAAGTIDKHIFQRRFAECDGIDLAGKRFDDLRDPLVPIGHFEPHGPIDHAGLLGESLLNAAAIFSGAAV